MNWGRERRWRGGEKGGKCPPVSGKRGNSRHGRRGGGRLVARIGLPRWVSRTGRRGNSPNMRKGKEYFVQGEKKSWRIFPQSFWREERSLLVPSPWVGGGGGGGEGGVSTHSHTRIAERRECMGPGRTKPKSSRNFEGGLFHFPSVARGSARPCWKTLVCTHGNRERKALEGVLRHHDTSENRRRRRRVFLSLPSSVGGGG